MADPVTITLTPQAAALYNAYQQAKTVSDADDGSLAAATAALTASQQNIINAQNAAMTQQATVNTLTAKDAADHQATSGAATSFVNQLISDLGIVVPPPAPTSTSPN